ncbi:MAG: site-2 protease family protein [Rickettsiales bacterium]
MPFDPLVLLIFGLPLLLAIPLHEAAHGFVAHRCGDPTAYALGRVTFNPLKHIDPLGTVILPIMLIISGAPFVFGWAKPVPVDFRRLKRPRRDSVLVAAAGPAVNLALAFISAIGVRYAMAEISLDVGAESLPWWGEMCMFSLMLNVALAVFNMLPLLPLDGGRVLNGLLPPSLAHIHARTERWGFPLLIGILVIVPMLGMLFHQSWSLFQWILLPPILWLADFLLMLSGAT